MILERTFAIETHEEFGTLGLRPTDMPTADPMEGMATAHDLMEHGPEDDGGIEAEFKALAVAVHLRYEGGYWSRLGLNSNPVDIIPGDFIDLYHHFAYEDYTLRDPGKMPPLADEEIDKLLSDVVDAGLKLTYDEKTYDDEEPEDSLIEFTSDEYRERILNWMRIGYAEGVTRYAGYDIYTVAGMFIEVQDMVNAFLKSDGPMYKGFEVTIKMDLDSGLVDFIHEDNEHDL